MAEHRLDETEVDDGAVATLINVARSSKWAGATNPDDSAAWLGLNPWAAGCLSWDLFDAVLAPSDVILLMIRKDSAAADGCERHLMLQDDAPLRRVRVVRDYGRCDQREAPQFYPDAADARTIYA